MNSISIEKNKLILPVVLCGGSGTRLWPLSRKSLPKQFVPLLNNKSLLDLTLSRIKVFNSNVLLVGSEEHRFLLKEALTRQMCQGDLILEPLAKNTAPAMAMAALWAREQIGNSGLLLFCPADHHIPDTDLFCKTIQQGVDTALSGSIVTFGVQPNHPSSAFGYIELGQELRVKSQNGHQADLKSNPFTNELIHLVNRFIEKPSPKDAQALLLKGNHLWNAGIFLTRCDTLLKALSEFAIEILDAASQAMLNQSVENITEKDQNGELKFRFVRPNLEALSNSPSQSIDYAVMEKHKNISVVGFSGQWSDVGSWNAVAELSPQDGSQNRIDGQGFAFQSSNTFIHAPHRTVVALGVENLLIIDTPDALLVASRTKAEDVKSLVDQLQKLDNPTALTHRKVARPWGWYDSVDHGERFQVKRICVKTGASLSLQKHHHRAEHWIVVKGTAEVTNGDKVFLLHENESTFIPAGIIHRLHNPGQMDLEMIEVQSGSYLGEDDIVRLEDTYGRN